MGNRASAAVWLQIYQGLVPDLVTPAIFQRAIELLADLYPGA